MARIDRILKAAEGTPWALAPGKMAILAEILAAKADAGQIPTASDISAIDARVRGNSKIATGGAVAVLPMFGTMSRRMGMLGAMSGGLSVETFSQQFAELVSDDSISAIVIDVDSPGGSVYGIEELSQQIFDARSKGKRIVAVANQLMASAAYYVASAADELAVSPSGEVGSLGVFSIHFDWSEAMADEGIKVTIIKAGDRKAEGNPYEALGEEAADHMQSMVDAYYSQFVAAVARNRGVSVAHVEEKYGQGLTFDSARALERGMVDRIATLDEVLSELTGQANPKRSSLAASDDGIGIAALDVQRDTVHVSIADASTGSVVEVFEAVTGRLTETLRSYRSSIDDGASPTIIEPEATEESEEPTEVLGQASVETPAPTEPAQVAREETVGDKVTDAPTAGAEDTAQLLVAERQRTASIRAVAREHGVDEAVADGWISNGTAIADVNAEVLTMLKERSAAAPVIAVVGDDRATKQPFASLGDQLISIMRAEMAGAQTDPRLLGINAAATGSGAAVPSDGGFLLQPDFSGEILRRVYDLGEVLKRVRRRPIGPDADGLKINAVSESSRVTGSRYGGIRVYWADEGDTVTAKKPKFRTMELYLRKLMGLWYVTDELLKDSTALQAIGEDAFSEEISFMVEDAIFRGTGSGQPLGFMNSDALISVAKESAQTAATVNATNVVKMNARLWPRSRVNAVWFINPDVEPQLPLMTIGNQPVYLPPGGLRESVYGNLLGHPVIPVEYSPTLGAVGDIMLVDLDQYLLIDKGAAMSAWSMHVRFVNDEQTFRITYRVDGQPTWNKALTPYQGTNTLSPFVALAVRE